jgi:ribosomal protein S18 acetylase RimI-like enzyme
MIDADDDVGPMTRLTDLSVVKTLLDRDRAWAAYAIGDLSPEYAADCEWYAPGDGSPAVLLLYRGFSPPIVFASGETMQLAPVFREIDAPTVSLHLRADGIAALRSTYDSVQTHAMWRMVIEPGSFRSAGTQDVVALDESSLGAVTALYDDGRPHDEVPTFFRPSMLQQGTFRGIWEGSDLIAVAGTHLFSPELGVCAVGNVYTRRDCRRRGLGARVTSAVVQYAIDQAIPTIVLNVGQENPGARRVYERLGFRCHCEFFEGEATA